VQQRTPLRRYTEIKRGKPPQRSSRLNRTRFKWKPKSRSTKTRRIAYGKEYADLRRQKAIAAN
jgi:hypothetical protein